MNPPQKHSQDMLQQTDRTNISPKACTGVDYARVTNEMNRRTHKSYSGVDSKQTECGCRGTKPQDTTGRNLSANCDCEGHCIRWCCNTQRSNQLGRCTNQSIRRGVSAATKQQSKSQQLTRKQAKSAIRCLQRHNESGSREEARLMHDKSCKINSTED